MAVIKTIGSGGDYSDINAWVVYLQGLGALQDDQIGQIKKSGISTTVRQDITGVSTNGFQVILESEPSGGFRDVANGVPNNALLYNAGIGAFLDKTSGSNSALAVNNGGTVIVRHLQIRRSGGFSSGVVMEGGSHVLDSCIILADDCNEAIFLRGATVRNCLIQTNGRNGAFCSSGGGALVNCTFINTGAAGSTIGIDRDYGTWTVTNCAFAGFATDVANTGWGTSSNNATDKASAGSSGVFATAAQISLLPATEFVNASSDFRLAAGSVKLKNNGTASGTPAVDIVGQSRSGTPDIGAWEYQAAGGGGSGGFLLRNRAADGGFHDITGGMKG